MDQECEISCGFPVQSSSKKATLDLVLCSVSWGGEKSAPDKAVYCIHPGCKQRLNNGLQAKPQTQRKSSVLLLLSLWKVIIICKDKANFSNSMTLLGKRYKKTIKRCGNIYSGKRTLNILLLILTLLILWNEQTNEPHLSISTGQRLIKWSD